MKRLRIAIGHLIALSLVVGAVGIASPASAAPESWPSLCVSGDKQAAKLFVHTNFGGGKESECGTIHAGGNVWDALYGDPPAPAQVITDLAADANFYGNAPPGWWDGEIQNKENKVTSFVVFNKTKASNHAGVCFVFYVADMFDDNAAIQFAIWVEGKPDGSKYRWEKYDFQELDSQRYARINDRLSSFTIWPPQHGDLATRSACLDFDEQDIGKDSKVDTGIVW